MILFNNKSNDKSNLSLRRFSVFEQTSEEPTSVQHVQLTVSIVIGVVPLLPFDIDVVYVLLIPIAVVYIVVVSTMVVDWFSVVSLKIEPSPNSTFSISIFGRSLFRVDVFKIDVTDIVWLTTAPNVLEHLFNFSAGDGGWESSGEVDDPLSSVLLISANLTRFSGVLVLEVGEVP